MRSNSLKKFGEQFSETSRSVAELLDDAEKGGFSFAFSSYASEDFAPLLREVKKALPALSGVVSSPNSVLRSDLERKRAEKATALSPQSIRETIRDPRLWTVVDGRMRPQDVYTPVNVEDLNVYENRVVKTLVDRVLRLLSVTMSDADRGIRSLRDAHFGSSSLSKIDLVRLLDGNPLDGDGRSGAFESYREIAALRRKFFRMRSTEFYQTMVKHPPFAERTVNNTSVFMLVKKYRDCYDLWNFLNRFELSLTGMDGARMQAAYAAFVSLSLVSAYRKMGMTVERDAEVRLGDDGFSLTDLAMAGNGFRVVMSVRDKIYLLVQRPDAKAQQRLTVGLYTDTVSQPDPDDDFSVCYYETAYGDSTVCARPDFGDSAESLAAIARLSVFTVRGDRSVYDSVCPVCGGKRVAQDGLTYRCDACDAVYLFVDPATIWINRFRSLDPKQEDDEILSKYL